VAGGQVGSKALEALDLRCVLCVRVRVRVCVRVFNTWPVAAGGQAGSKQGTDSDGVPFISAGAWCEYDRQPPLKLGSHKHTQLYTHMYIRIYTHEGKGNAPRAPGPRYLL
jgi:hypothetical protein